MSAVTIAAVVAGMGGTAFAADKAPKPTKTTKVEKADKKSTATTSAPSSTPSSSSSASSSAASTGSATPAGSSAASSTSASSSSAAPSSTSTTAAAKDDKKAGGKASPATASQCGEDSFLGTQFPALGTPVNVGEEIGATYHDETPLNQQTVLFKVDNGTVTPLFNAGVVPKGDKFATKISYVIPSNLAAGTHTASLYAEDTDQNKTGGDCGQATWTFTVANHTPTVDLGVTKTASPGAVLVGQQVTYTINVTNNGPDADTGVKAVDVLPAGVTFLSAAPSAGTCNEASGTITCSFGDMASGASRSVAVKVNAPAVAGTIVNKVDVTGDVAETTMANNHAEAAVVVTKAPAKVDLAVTKTADPTRVQVNGTVVYTLTVTNNGPDADAAVKLVDTLPAGVTFVSAKPAMGSCSESGSAITCNLGTMNNGDSAKVLVTVSAPKTAGSILNKADVTGATPETDMSNNHAEAPVDVFTNPPAEGPKVDLAITKTADQPSVAVNGALTYTLRAVNNGPDTATNVVVTDTLPTGMKVNAISPSTGSCNRNDLVITCSLGTMVKGATATITVSTNAPAKSGDITNRVHVAGSEPDTNLANNDDQVTTPVSEVLGVSVSRPLAPAAPAVAPAVAPAAPKGPLPFTGANSRLLAMLGTGLTIMAAGFLLAGRRRTAR